MSNTTADIVGTTITVILTIAVIIGITFEIASAIAEHNIVDKFRNNCVTALVTVKDVKDRDKTIVIDGCNKIANEMWFNKDRN